MGAKRRRTIAAGEMLNKGERTRGRIKEVFAELLENKSFASITIADICRASDVTVGGFYFHFVSQDELLNEVMWQYADDLMRVVDAAIIDGPRTPLAVSVCSAFLRAYAAQSGLARRFSSWSVSVPTTPHAGARRGNHALRGLAGFCRPGGRSSSRQGKAPGSCAHHDDCLQARSELLACQAGLPRQPPGVARHRAGSRAALDSHGGWSGGRMIERSREPAPPRRQSRGERTRQKIKDAVIGLLEERDYFDLTITDICRTAKVATGGFYFHYEKKATLIEEVLREHSADLWSALEGALHYDAHLQRNPLGKRYIGAKVSRFSRAGALFQPVGHG